MEEDKKKVLELLLPRDQEEERPYFTRTEIMELKPYLKTTSREGEEIYLFCEVLSILPREVANQAVEKIIFIGVGDCGHGVTIHSSFIDERSVICFLSSGILPRMYLEANILQQLAHWHLCNPPPHTIRGYGEGDNDAAAHLAAEWAEDYTNQRSR